MQVIGEAEKAISKCLREIEPKLTNTSGLNSQLQNFRVALSEVSELEKKRYVFLVGLKYLGEQIKHLVSSSAEELSYIEGRLGRMAEIFP